MNIAVRLHLSHWLLYYYLVVPFSSKRLEFVFELFTVSVPVTFILSVLGILFCLLMHPTAQRLRFKKKEFVDTALGGGGTVLPIMTYTGRLRSKGVSFSGFRCSQTPLIPDTDHEGVLESVHINLLSTLSGVKLRENVRTFFPNRQSKLSATVGCKAGFDRT